MGKLSGIKVIDLSLFLPGPMLTMMMADQGAEVWKVEPAAGDPARDQAPFQGGQSVWFRGLNRGKRSVVLDLKSEEGKARLWDMIADADVFVEGFRPGVMARLGFDYAAVSACNPAIVYCSISAFGQSGDLAHHPAHDMAVQAMAGFLSVNDGVDGTPVVPGAAAADMAAGLTGLSAVLMALIGRAQTSRGDYIDCAMFDALLPWCAHVAGAAIAGGVTSVACMPNTEPAIDTRNAAEYVILQAKRAGNCNVFPIGAVTKGREGKELAEIGKLVDGGAVAFTDDGAPVYSAEIMRRALEYCKKFDRTVLVHAEILELTVGGVMNEGEVSFLMHVQWSAI